MSTNDSVETTVLVAELATLCDQFDKLRCLNRFLYESLEELLAAEDQYFDKTIVDGFAHYTRWLIDQEQSIYQGLTELHRSQ